MRTNIFVKNIDVLLLRKQRDHLLVLLDLHHFDITQDNEDEDAYHALMDVIKEEQINGLINMLDTMLDTAENNIRKKEPPQ